MCEIKNKNINNVDGYTLIEVIIALTITSIAFVAIYALFARTMQSDAESRYEIVAAALSQEGVEIIKNKREKNEMVWAIWDAQGVEPSFYDNIDRESSGSNPDIDLINGNILWGNTAMQYNSTSKKYEGGCSGTCVGPVFTRKCDTTLENSGGINEFLRVVCVVEWNSLLLGGEKRSAKTEVVLTDWQR